jgi:hypothetical protein
MSSRGPLDGHATDLLEASVAYGDRWFDPAVGLLWNPAGSLAPAVRDATVHLIPQSAWYAFGLLERGRPGDTERALSVIEVLLGHQYDRPDSAWHGTFSQVAERPEPGPGADREWVDYDPNWRQFIGTTFLLVLRHHSGALDVVLRSRLEQSLRLAITGEPPGRVSPAYSNIALMKAVLEIEAGHLLGEPSFVAAGESLAAAVVARFDRFGAFDEYNSATYYGIDLLGLALWRTCVVSAQLREWGARLEAALWEDTAIFFHAGLRNLVGPFSRTYGMDMGRYLGAVGLWWWPLWGLDQAPLPDLEAVSIEHGHDLLLGSLVARLAGRVPGLAAELLTGFEGVRQVERRIAGDPERVATAWLEPDLAFGGEGDAALFAAEGQFAPATVHWLVPTGQDPATPSGPATGSATGPATGLAGGPDRPLVGTARFHCADRTAARATDGVLRITTVAGSARTAEVWDAAFEEGTASGAASQGGPSGTPAPADAAFLLSMPTAPGVPPLVASMIEPGRWNLPGLALRVQTSSVLLGAEPFGDDLLVTYRSPAAVQAGSPADPPPGHRFVLRRVAGA